MLRWKGTKFSFLSCEERKMKLNNEIGYDALVLLLSVKYRVIYWLMIHELEVSQAFSLAGFDGNLLFSSILQFQSKCSLGSPMDVRSHLLYDNLCCMDCVVSRVSTIKFYAGIFTISSL
ncbi:hypothetical protein E2542_SST23594 [Spatholobus suberectus]|nr:hypothetical protein E2542_SST23594 [Spatholobus suberectus]